VQPDRSHIRCNQTGHI